MSRVYSDTVLPEDSGVSQDLTLGTTGDTVQVTSGATLKLNTVKDSGANTIFTSDGSGNLSSLNSEFTGGPTLIQSQTASGDASISFTANIDSTYRVYLFKFIDIGPTSDGTDFTFNGSTDGGSTYAVTKTTTFFRAYHAEGDSSSGLDYEPNEDLSQSTAYQNLSIYCGADADECTAGELYLYVPSSTTYVKHFYSTVAMTQGGEGVDSAQNIFTAGYFNTATAINAIDFKCSAGNFDGTIKMYGL